MEINDLALNEGAIADTVNLSRSELGVDDTSTESYKTSRRLLIYK